LRNTRAGIFFFLAVSILLGNIFASGSARAADDAVGYYLPTVENGGLSEAKTPQQVATVLKTMALLTFLTLAPSILLLTTSFTRIVIVLSFLRRALGTNTLPPDQVMVGLALFLTMFIMAPTWEVAWNNGLRPYLDGDLVEGRPMTQEEMFERVMAPHRAFMFGCMENNRGEEIQFFMGMYGKPVADEASFTREQVPTHVLLPAFVTSELKRSFWMGFLLYLPFLILDMVIASILMSMGMMMLPPVMISLPFKIILFVMVDGWRLTMEGIVTSFPADIVPQLAGG